MRIFIRKSLSQFYYLKKFEYKYQPKNRDIVLCLHGFNYKHLSDNYGQMSKIFLYKILRAINKKFQFIALDEIISGNLHSQKGDNFPKAAITIDDGFLSTLNVLEVFQRFNVIPTIYICPQLINEGRILFPEIIRNAFLVSKKKYFSPPLSEQIVDLRNFKLKISLINKWVEYFKLVSHDLLDKELNKLFNMLGVSNEQIKNSEYYDPLIDFNQIRDCLKVIHIGSHTNNHYNLSTLPPNISYQEIKESKLRIERELSIECKTIAYPFGNINAFGEREKEYAKTSGYHSGFSFVNGYFENRIDKFSCNRCSIGNGMKDIFMI